MDVHGAGSQKTVGQHGIVLRRTRSLEYRPGALGPWSTAFYTERWDIGPGEHGDFPAKWMSEGGREPHLVFSDDDSFSVRKAALVLTSDGRQKQ